MGSAVNLGLSSYTTVFDGNKVYVDRDFEEQLKSVCVCDLEQYQCVADEHDHVSKGKLPSQLSGFSLADDLKREFPCPYRYQESCWKTFHDSNYSWKHVQKEHSQYRPEKTLSCTWNGCKRMFHQQGHMDRHIQITHLKGKAASGDVEGENEEDSSEDDEGLRTAIKNSLADRSSK